MKEEKYNLFNYSIIGATSEDLDQPFYSILSESNQSGWCSERFCKYPQELIIKFNIPGRLKQINLILHETKIPSKIDFYYFFPENENSLKIELNKMPFVRLGYITPNTNEKTNFKAREFKKIHVDQNVLFLKFVLHKNFLNLQNKYNQVGMISIQCLGIPFTKNNINILCPNYDQSIDYFEQNPINLLFQEEQKFNDKELDEICQAKMKEIKMIYEECLKKESYENAKIFSELYQRVRLLGEKIKVLTDCKMKCIETNDFDSCKKLKNDIERIKEIVNNINLNYTNFEPNNSFFKFKNKENNTIKPDGLNKGVEIKRNFNIDKSIDISKIKELKK